MSKIAKVQGTITYEDGEQTVFTVSYGDTTGVFWRQDGHPPREIAGRSVDVLDAIQAAVVDQRDAN